MQEVAAAVTIRRAHYLAGNGFSRLRPRHLERPKTFLSSLLSTSGVDLLLTGAENEGIREEYANEEGLDGLLSRKD